MPPPRPPIDVLALLERLSLAERARGRLDGVPLLLPRQELFLYMHVRKEAVLYSQIEGTQSTLSDLLRFETGAQAGEPIDGIREVSGHVDAMMHGRLLQGGRGKTKAPGEFRCTRNRVGGSRPGNALHVPPPVAELDSCLDALEGFFHDNTSGLSALIKAGLIHVQFEIIHPFLDGNGRIGRLLLTLCLGVQGVLRTPLLYLSLYLETHRVEYCRRLQEVRERGNWEAWPEFFLAGVAKTADQAFDAVTRIVDLFQEDRERITMDNARAGPALRLHDWFRQMPFLTSGLLVKKTGLTAPTVNAALAELEHLGIVKEITGRRRGRVYGYGRYPDIPSEGTEPPSGV